MKCQSVYGSYIFSQKNTPPLINLTPDGRVRRFEWYYDVGSSFILIVKAQTVTLSLPGQA